MEQDGFEKSGHANRHVAKFLELPKHLATKAPSTIQLVHDGKQLTADRLLKNDDLTLKRPILILDSPQSIGMKLPGAKGNKQVSVRDIAELLGNDFPVNVIDVEHQEELESWSMGDLVDYFEDEARLLQQRRMRDSSAEEGKTEGSRRRRKAAEKCMDRADRERPRVLNQISLEFSKTPLGEKVLSPKFVRDLDWIDNAWPRERKGDTLARPPDEVYPMVQYYCLTSAAGCYTDFHVDFGGTSVWYHVLNGEKDFCLIRPTKENLAIYEDWLCRPNQAELFLPDMIPDLEGNVLRVTLMESQTLIIPAAWIHAVYTPIDSLVFGGNFLHGIDLPLQLSVHGLEARTRVREKFRFPHFLPINFYAGGFYLDKLRRGIINKVEVEGLGELVDALEEWWKVHQHSQTIGSVQAGPTVASAALECARWNQCGKNVESFLAELRKELDRVIRAGKITPNSSAPIAVGRMENWAAAAGTARSSATAKPKIRLSLKASPVPVPVLSKAEPSNSEDTTTASANAGTSKLRLSMKGRTVLDNATSSGVPEIEMIASQVGPSQMGTTQSKSPPKFRIHVSSSKWNKPKRARDDADEWVDEGAPLEEEWVPSGKKSQGRERDGTGASMARSNVKSQTSRQRLMKRFR